LVPVLFAFYLQSVLKFKCKIPAPKGSRNIKNKCRQYEQKFIDTRKSGMAFTAPIFVIISIARNTENHPNRSRNSASRSKNSCASVSKVTPAVSRFARNPSLRDRFFLKNLIHRMS